MSRLRQLFVGTAAAILSYQLLLPPVVALADNGDFPKVIGRFDLWAQVHRTYLFSDTIYVFDHTRHWVSDFYSTEIPLARASIALNSLLSKDGNFDIRMIGVVHGALFLLALWLLAPLLEQSSRRVRIAVCALALFFYCDVMYVSGLSSFYMDEPTYLFLLLAVVFYLRAARWRRRADFIGLAACTLLMTLAKTQHVLLAFWIALLILLNRRLLWTGRQAWAVAAALMPVAAAVFMMTAGVPRDYSQFPVYNVVFAQILPHAKDRDRTMADLGLDASYRQFIGKGAYYSDSHMEESDFRTAFGQRLNMGKLAVFYLRHPRDAWQTLTHALGEAGRQQDFGTFDTSLGYGPLAQSQAFNWWSAIKSRIFFHRGHRYLWVFTGLSALLAALLYLQRRSLPLGLASAGYVLIGMAWTELGTSALADSMDIARHHLIFFALSDAMLLVAVAAAVSYQGSGIRPIARRTVAVSSYRARVAS